MAFPGYFDLAGTEIINCSRTEQYAAHMPWFRAVYNNDLLPLVLDRQFNYVSPRADNAPWYDPDIKESEDFFGAYPLDVQGLEDSSRTSTVVEFTVDGGVPGRIRHATKSIVFSVALIAASEAGAAYGLEWLRRALLGAVCDRETLSSQQGQGADLTYLSSEPRYADTDAGTWRMPTTSLWSYADPERTILQVNPDLPEDYVSRDTDPEVLLIGPSSETSTDPYSPSVLVINDPESGLPVQGAFDDPAIIFLRFLRRVRRFAVNRGPSITAKRATSCGGAVWTVQFTGVAGSPFEFSSERPIIQGYPSANPWVPGVEQGSASTSATTHTEVVCDDGMWDPIYDPLAPALLPPPALPAVPVGNWNAPSSWQRRTITIPASNVPVWGEAAPVVTIYSDTGVRGLRVRFYDDPDGSFDPDAAPCEYTGDMVASYIPPGGTMIIDTAFQESYVVTSLGHRRRADSLVFATDGSPAKWPVLSCGYGYVMTLDLLAGETMPTVDVSLIARRL